MSTAPSETSFQGNLAERYRRVMSQSHQNPEEPDFTKMSLTELGQSVITFGEAKKGQSFEKVVQGDQSYVMWFTNKFQHSQKYQHRRFLHYVQRFVDQEEETQTSTQPKSRAMPKSQGLMMVNLSEETAPAIDLSDDENPMWDVIEGQRQQLNWMENQQSQRISNLEVALGQIVGQLQELTHHLKGAQEQ